MTGQTRTIIAAFAAAALALPAAAQGADGEAASSQSSTSPGALSLSLPDGVTKDMLGKRTLETLALQTMLDRSRHSPGVIDGYMGGNTRRAIRYYRMANGLPEGDAVDDELLRSLAEKTGNTVFARYTITQDDVSQDFSANPDGFADMAEDDALNYESPIEMLGERFHMTQGLLRALNPGADFGSAGTEIVIVKHGDETLSADIARIEVRKSEKSVAVLDSSGALVASYPATIGSDEFPSPSGSMEVKAVATEPAYYFSPEGRQWGPDKRFKIAPGPNNPIGGTWIDLSKEGYGIHGSPEPKMVGKRTSHGCVRLTNWDADELAKAVSTGVTVSFT